MNSFDLPDKGVNTDRTVDFPSAIVPFLSLTSLYIEKKMKSMTTAVSVFATAAICAAASATTVDVQFTGTGPGQGVNIVSPGFNGGVFAGVILINATNSSNTVAFQNGAYAVFCCDLYQYANGGVNQYNVVPVSTMPTSAPMGAAAAQAINDMYVFAAGNQYLTADYATAFQLAVWEVVTDFGFGLDLSTGLVQASGYNGTVGAISSALFASINGLGNANIQGVSSIYHQDYIVENSGNIPAPGAMALVGLAGLIGNRRRHA
ncbi:MAG: hypothetical protein K8R92_05085 [Planctomycetes bacterium]|nr:hypothetical protein [Planctomycetota bacterium]